MNYEENQNTSAVTREDVKTILSQFREIEAEADRATGIPAAIMRAAPELSYHDIADGDGRKWRRYEPVDFVKSYHPTSVAELNAAWMERMNNAAQPQKEDTVEKYSVAKLTAKLEEVLKSHQDELERREEENKQAGFAFGPTIADGEVSEKAVINLYPTEFIKNAMKEVDDRLRVLALVSGKTIELSPEVVRILTSVKYNTDIHSYHVKLERV